jgi:hypothetical protein
MDEFWLTVLSSGIVAAIFSTIFGGVFSLYIVWYKSKRESEAGIFKARAELYSYLLFWLRTWLNRDIDNYLSWEDFTTVDKYLSKKLYLISLDIQKEWLELHGLVTEKKHVDAVEKGQKLVHMIESDFNQNIIPKYEKYVGKNIQKLTSYTPPI